MSNRVLFTILAFLSIVLSCSPWIMQTYRRRKITQLQRKVSKKLSDHQVRILNHLWKDTENEARYARAVEWGHYHLSGACGNAEERVQEHLRRLQELDTPEDAIEAFSFPPELL